jgi:LysR family nitrogen assimilation transcriptional regulator
MEFRTVECYICVAETGSISAAAQKLGIVQPALTRHIRRLEDEYGTPLFIRLPRGVRLTSAGRELLEHFRRIADELKRAKHELGERGTQPRGNLVFGSTATLGGVLMPSVVEQCVLECPGISLKVVESRSVHLHEMLLSGALDVALLTNPTGSHRLSLQTLLSEPLCLVQARTEGTSTASVSAAELEKVPLVVAPGMRGLARGDGSTVKLQLNVAAEIDSIETIKALVRSGRFGTVTPASTFRRQIGEGIVVARTIDAPDRNRLLVLASRTDNCESPAVREIMRIVRTEAKLRLTGDFSIPFPSSALPGVSASR